MRIFCIILATLLFQSCRPKITVKTGDEGKYDFIQKDKYKLLDSLQLPGLGATLFSYVHPDDKHPADCELIKTSGTNEIIFIPAIDAGFLVHSGLEMQHLEYDYRYVDLVRYLNEHRDKFRNINRFKKDLQAIFTNTIKLDCYLMKVKFNRTVTHYDTLPMDSIPYPMRKYTYVFNLNFSTNQGYSLYEQVLLTTPGFIQTATADSVYSDADFFLIRDIFSYERLNASIESRQ